jgi:hypothetical protein
MNAFLKRKWLFIPYILLGVGVIGGTAAWFYGKGMVSERLDLEFAKQKTQGIEITCNNRDIGGFPLKYIVTCPKFQVKRDAVSATIENAVFVAQIWNRKHVIAELHTPIMISHEKGNETKITSEPIMISINHSDESYKRVSMVLKSTEIQNKGFSFKFANGEIHSSEINGNTKPEHKSNLILNELTTNIENKNYTAKSFKLISDSQMSSRLANESQEAVVKWFKDGGSLQINELSFYLDDYGIKIDGKAQLNAEKLLDATMNLRLWGLDKGIETIKSQSQIDQKLIAMLQGLITFAKKETIEGKDTHAFAFSSDKGQVKMQGLPIYNLPAIK